MVLRAIDNLGAATIRFIESLGAISLFGGAVIGNTLRPPLRTRMLIKELYKQGVQSLSIIGISGLAVGMVIGLQGYNTLVRYGSENQLGVFVGFSIVLELGPVLTALLLTGRAGSATTAEIGTMVATEQLDGLRMMSINPVNLVVVPRALGLFLVTPLLTALFVVLALFGGYLIGVGMMGVDPGAYMGNLQEAMDFPTDVVGCFVKAFIFGCLISLISTFRGVTCAPNSAGVSAATTATVVQASLCILIADYIITALWGF